MTQTATTVTAATTSARTLARPVPTQQPLLQLAQAIPYNVYEAEKRWRGSTANVHEFALDLDAFVRDKLPSINRSIEGGSVGVDELMTQARVLISILQPALPQLLATADHRVAKDITRCFGLIAASIERHAQAVQANPGDGVQAVAGFTDVLCAWSKTAGVSPMLDYDAYWLTNRTNPLTFTGEREELVFNNLVNRTVDVVAEIMTLLNELRTGARECDAMGTAAEVDAQGRKLVSLYEAYRDLGRKDENGVMMFSPTFFMRMRQYLLSFPIDGVMREGPNATYSPNQTRIDIGLGMTTPDYLATITDRLTKMTPVHRAMIENEMSMPSITDVIINGLELKIPDCSLADPAEVRRRADARAAGFADTLSALKRLAQAQIQLSNVHFGRIVTHLVKPSSALSKTEAKAMPVKPTAGVGGNDLGHTRSIVDMRKAHPFVTTLLAAF